MYEKTWGNQMAGDGMVEVVGGAGPAILDTDHLNTHYDQSNRICPRLCCYGEPQNNLHVDMHNPEDAAAHQDSGRPMSRRASSQNKTQINNFFCCNNSIMHSTNKEIQIYCMQSDKRKVTKVLQYSHIKGEKVCLRNDLLIFNDLNMSEDAVIQVEMRENAALQEDDEEENRFCL